MNKKNVVDTSARAPKVTKELLLKENALLTERLESMIREDFNRRTTLSKLLGNYSIVRKSYDYRDASEKQIEVESWLGIAFLIGELKSDANYSLCIETRETLRRENDALYAELKALKAPPLHDGKNTQP